MKNLFNKLTSMVMTTVMFLGITLAAPAFAFPDVQNHWAKADILELAEKKILGGKDANWFDPEANITRAEYVAICNRAFPDAISVERNVQFSDVTSDYWFYADVLKAANAKLIEGRSSTTFDPMAPITRQEAAVITHNYLVKIEFEFTTSAATIKDINAVAEFAKTAVTKLVQSGIISGYEDGEFRPNSNITRAESATVINRVLKKIAEEQGDISGLDPGKKSEQKAERMERIGGDIFIEYNGKTVLIYENGSIIIIDGNILTSHAFGTGNNNSHTHCKHNARCMECFKDFSYCCQKGCSLETHACSDPAAQLFGLNPGNELEQKDIRTERNNGKLFIGIDDRTILIDEEGCVFIMEGNVLLSHEKHEVVRVPFYDHCVHYAMCLDCGYYYLYCCGNSHSCLLDRHHCAKKTNGNTNVSL